MVGEKMREGLFSAVASDDGLVVVNGRVQVRTADGHRVVTCRGAPFAHFELADRMAEAHAMVSLVEQGWAEQVEVARAFGCSERSVRRYQRRFEDGGLAALGRPKGFPKGQRRTSASRSSRALRLKQEGLSTREVARRMGVTEKAIRKLLRREGWAERVAVQQALPFASGADPKLSGQPAPSAAPPMAAAAAGADPKLSGEPTESGFSLDEDAADRRMDRLLAFLGLIDDAVPLFRGGASVPRAGVLLAIPALVDSGVFEIARSVYGSIGPAFYGLRTMVATLLLSALLRIKRPEAFKEHSPPDLGRLLGLDRAPEVKTVRRKLGELADLHRAADFGRELARRRVARLGDALGFLYVDGHVRVYHGKHDLPKTHVARMRLALPATSDYWVNDEKGDPLFVMTAPANAGMVQMLPSVLEEIRKLVGLRRLTVVFDRGGYSAKVFKAILAAGFDLLTYRKGPFRRVRLKDFERQSAVIDGRKVEYVLADQSVRIKGCPSLRQVVRLSQGGHQTPVLTSRRDLSAVEVAFHMFERWRQENFFKYLREEYALDALVDYDTEPDDPDREVPNPARKAIDLRLKEAVAELDRLRAEHGLEATINMQDLQGFTRRNQPRIDAVLGALGKVMRLEKQRATIPARVPVGTLKDEVIKLAPERKHLTNLFKMVAYQAESDLVRQLAPHYARAEDEGRTLIQNALNSAADIDIHDGELVVTLAPLSSAHRSKAVAALCAELTGRRVAFPGTNLVMRWAVRGIA
jgi:transposase